MILSADFHLRRTPPRARGELIQKTAIIGQAVKEFDEKMPERCPLCGRS